MRSAELLREWAGGDAGAGTALVREHFPAVYRFVRRRVGSGAEDVTQRTFEAALAQADRFRPELSFRAYLLGIARKQALMHQRRQAMARRRLVDVEGTHPGPSPSVTRRLAAREEHQRLLDAMQSLSSSFRAVLELYYWEELAVKEIAAVLEIPLSTVTSRLWRARASLRDAMRGAR